MTYGITQPKGIEQRCYTMDPTGNNEEAEAARAALSLYADRLAQSSHRRLQEKAAKIRNWVEDEEITAGSIRADAAELGAAY